MLRIEGGGGGVLGRLVGLLVLDWIGGLGRGKGWFEGGDMAVWIGLEGSEMGMC